MFDFKITLTSINQVRKFVNDACSQMCDIDIISGRYVIDAKSIMGLFSLDTTKPLTVSVKGSQEEYEAFRELCKDIIVKD